MNTQNWEMIQLLIDNHIYYKESLSGISSVGRFKSFGNKVDDEVLYRERPLTVGDFIELIVESVPKSMMKELAERLNKDCTELIVAL